MILKITLLKAQKLITLTLLFTQSALMAIVPYATKYCLDDKECVLLYDLHMDKREAKTSKKQLETIIEHLKKDSCPLIVEDMFAYEGDDAEIKDKLPLALVNWEVGPELIPNTGIISHTSLFGLCKRCQQENITALNVDFRQAYQLMRHYALRGMGEESILAQDKLFNAFTAVCTEIEGYNDTSLLNDYYREVLESVTPDVALVKTYARKDYAHLSSQERRSFLKAFWNCMIQILDARMIHIWHQQSLKNKKVVVFAGGKHIKALEKIMLRMGYAKVAHQGDKSIIKQSMDYFKKGTIQLQFEQVLGQGLKGLVAFGSNIVTLVKAINLNKAYTNQCHEALKKAESVDLDAVFKATLPSTSEQ